MWTIVLNPTNWLLLALGAAALFVPPRILDVGARDLERFRVVSAILATAALLTGASVAARLTLGYAAPGAYAEEVAAARLLLDGRHLSGNERDAFREWTAEEQVSHEWLAEGLSACQAGAATDRARFFTSQGHPPFLIAASVPVVAWAGGRALFVVMSLSSLALLAFIGWRLVPELLPAAAPVRRALAVVAILGWQPVLAGLRQGDAALAAGALIIMAWGALRRDCAVVAGVWLGAAASVSAGALLVVPLMAIRKPRAGAAALVTLIAGLSVAITVGGFPLLLGTAEASLAAALTYAGAGFNYSLLGRALMGSFTAPALLTVTMVSCAYAVWRTGCGRSGDRLDDRAADLLAALSPLAVLGAPVAFSQHLAFMLLPLCLLLDLQFRRRSRVGLLAWCVLTLVLALPDQTVRWANAALASLVHVEPASIVPLPAAAVVAVAVWLAGYVTSRAGATMRGTVGLAGLPHPAWAAEAGGDQA